MKKYLKSILFIYNFIREFGGIKLFVSRARDVFKAHGFRGVAGKIKHILYHAIKNESDGFNDNPYQKWIEKYDDHSKVAMDKMQHIIDDANLRTTFSIILPTYNSNVSWLTEAIESVQNQIYPYWELCISDDASTNTETIKLLKHFQEADKRIKLVFRNENGHISTASNSAIQMATGDYIVLLDHDDKLSKDALFRVAEAIRKKPDTALIYSDEDKFDNKGKRSNPYFKCDWNYQLFLSQNMISHLGVYKTEIVKQIGGFRTGFEGSQDYDLALRFIDKINENQIVHIPRVLYHWRLHKYSTSMGLEKKPYAEISAQKAISEHLERNNITAKVEILPNHMYRVNYQLPEKLPLVSIIIPTKNNLFLLKKCIDSIFKHTSYPHFEITVIDNNSDDPELVTYFDEISSNTKIQVLPDNRPFNFSAINNLAASKVRGDLLLFLNDDTEVISPNWISEMVSLIAQPKVGVVGARLWYPNNTLQHAGVILGIGGVASHTHKNTPMNNGGYFERANLQQEFSAVTGACMMTSKKIFDQAGGFDEENLAIAFNDVDLCLKIKLLGKRIIWTPYAELYHHESVSRGDDFAAEKRDRFMKENNFMLNKWGDIIQNDPAYSPNLSLGTTAVSLAFPPRRQQLF